MNFNFVFLADRNSYDIVLANERTCFGPISFRQIPFTQHDPDFVYYCAISTFSHPILLWTIKNSLFVSDFSNFQHIV